MVSDVVSVVTQPEQRTPAQSHEGHSLLRTHLQLYKVIHLAGCRFNHMKGDSFYWALKQSHKS